jgi:transcriptional regulator with XRE-family HTH domain
MKHTFGKRLRWLREFKELTLREFADRVAADPGYLSKLETGKANNASRRFLTRVVVAFRVNSEWLASGSGDPFWEVSKDDGTRNALPDWSEKRLQRIMAVLDELPDALAIDAVLGCLFQGESLEGFQAIWNKVMALPNLPVPARLFWNDVYVRFQVIKMDEELRRKAGLTTASDFRKVSGDMKSAMKALLDKVRKLSEPSGMKAKLAAGLGVPQARVSEWLSGKYDPSGETTLKLLHWVEQQERQK